MPKLKKERILAKLNEMENYVKELEDILPDNDEYVKDIIKRRACEKTAELAIEVLIDVCAMVVSYEKLGLPTSEDNLFDILVKKNIITEKLSSNLKEMKGFRNIIVHKYGEVDDSLAYEFLSTDIKDFSKFKEAIIKHLKK